MLNAFHDGKTAKIFKAIALGFIALGVSGLVFMDVGGVFRGGTGTQTIARVGNTKINAIDFEREAAQILRAQGLSVQEAYRFGTLASLLNEKIDSELLRQEAFAQKLSLDRQTVAAIVHNLIQAQIQPGETAQSALDRILRSQGMTEAQLIASVNQSETASLLQTPLMGAGSYVPELAARALARFQAERRDISFFSLSPEQAGRDIKADEATLKAYFDSLKDQYQVPEQRNFKVLTLNANTIKSDPITEEELKAAYNNRREQFRIGEQRRIEQIVIRNADEAARIATAAREGGTLQSLAPNTNNYRQPQDVSREGLPENMAEAVFNAQQGTVLNPISTPLGYHVIRVIDIKPARIQDFAAVRNDLRRELESDALHQEVESRIARIDESISAGESIDDIAAALETETRVIGPIDIAGNHDNAKPDQTLTALAANRDLLASLFELMEGETGDLTETADGVFSVFSLESVRPSRDREFHEVKADIEKRWLDEQRRAALNASIDAAIKRIETGERSFDEAARDLGAKMRTVRDVSRESKVAGLSDPIALGRLFDETDLNRIVRVNTQDGVILAKVLDARIPAAGEAAPKPEMVEQWRIQTQMALNHLFYNELRKKHGVRINDKAFERAFSARDTSF